MQNDHDGLLYTAVDPSGSFRLGWLCREDRPNYDDLSAWHDALVELEVPAGLRLLALRRCHENEALQIMKRAASIG